MARKLKSDKVLFLATLLLLCLSVVMVYSASAQIALERFRQPAYLFLTKQFLWMALGVSLMAIVMKIDYRAYRQPAVFWTLAAIAIVALILVLFSPPTKGARRWFNLGGIGIQPSELAKLAAVVFIAAVLERRAHRINDLGYSLPPIALVLGVMVGLVYVEPDFGTAMAIVVIAAVMVFAAGLSYTYLLTLTLAALPMGAILLLRTQYRRQRLLAFLDPWSDPLQDGFQIIQSYIAFGSGQLWGRGLGESRQKLFYLPDAHTDFIFSVIGEELGLLGALAVLALFGVILVRGFRLAARIEEPFCQYLAFGTTTLLGLQALIHMGVVMGLMPTKGLVLPFISYGGSAMVMNMTCAGILLSLSRGRM